MVCSACGTHAADDARVCPNCGRALDTVSRHGPEDETDPEFLEVAIGPKRTGYYVTKFQRFANGGGLVTWNWPAFFVPLLWMLYRKMWLYAALYFFVLPLALLMLAIVLALTLPETIGVTVFWVVQLGIIFGLIPMYANAAYHRVVQKRIRSAQASHPERERQLRALAGTGGTSNAAFIVVLVMIVPFVGILAAIAIPAYQDYTIRAQVTEGLNLAAAPKAAVVETFVADGTMPVDRSEAGLSPDPTDTSGLYVSAVDVARGRIDVVYAESANSIIANKTLSITPYGVRHAEDRWSVAWRCAYGDVPIEATHEIADYRSGDIPARYLPSACRPQP
jgi:Tfp pilus assembly major pilin PilA